MDVTILLFLLQDGIINGAVYALAALALVLVFTVTRPGALKIAKPGTAEFRAAIRDQLETSKNVYLNNGLSNITPTDHNGYDERSAFMIKVEDGAFHLIK